MPYLVILAGDTNTSTVLECKIYTLSLAIVNIRVAYDVRGHASGALLRIMICTLFLHIPSMPKCTVLPN